MSSGRKKSFDQKVALESAMQVFWQKGYTGASLADLTHSMGINKPSMYSTFGNKEQLFVKTTAHYVNTRMRPHGDILQQISIGLRQRIKRYMMTIIAQQCEKSNAKGCYIVLCQSELASGNIPSEAATALRDVEAAPKAMINQLLSSDPEAIDLQLNTRAEDISLTIYTMLKGTASMARAGITSCELEIVVDNTLNGIGLPH